MIATCKKEWNENDFVIIEDAITKHFSGRIVKTHHHPNGTQLRSFADIDTTFGLAYTSSGGCAAYHICNDEVIYDSTRKYEYFTLTDAGEPIAVLYDKDENETHLEMSEPTTKEAVLKRCTVEGNIVKLPPEKLDRELYVEVKNSLELIGGKWKGGKTQGFVFSSDPTELLKQVADGEQRNLKKEFQFFGTPAKRAAILVERANITHDNMLILEPEAGQGAIVNAILAAHPEVCVHGYELMEINRTALAGIKDFILLGDDFLQASPRVQFDRIIANPPFNKNQDIDHIRKMYEVCKKGGRIVTMAGNSWRIGSQKKQVEFREWLDEINATVEDVEAGEFKESGTNIATCMITIDK